VQTRNESAADVVALVEAEIDRLGAQPVGADELAARKATLLGDLSRSLETTSGLAAAIVALVAGDRPVEDLPARVEALGQVGTEQIQRFADAHLGAGARRLVVAGDLGRIGPALAARSGAHTVDAARLELDPGAAPPRVKR
jgi:zinc protease